MRIINRSILILCLAFLSNILPAQCNTCAHFSYPDSVICQSSGPLYIDSLTTPGGNFSINSPDLIVDPVSGTIYTTANTQSGSYQVTYTAPSPCNLTCTQTITVLPTSQAFFFYPSQEVCMYPGSPPLQPTLGSSAPDTFFSSPPGLALDPSSGEIDLDASAPGVYTVQRQLQIPCSGIFILELNLSLPDTNASLQYPQEVYCPSELSTTPTLTVDSAGFFPAVPGLAFSDTAGTIDLSNSQPGLYEIRFEIVGVCPITLLDTIEITPLTDPAFAYSPGVFCSNDPNPIPSPVNPGGTYVMTTGAGDTIPYAINPNTGEILMDTLNESESPYFVCYTPNSTCTSSLCQSYVYEEIVAPEIEVVGNQLQVNNVFGDLTWYLNGQVIATNQSFITPTVNGQYIAELNLIYCSASDTLSFVVGSEEPLLSEQQVQLFPNPGFGTVSLKVDLKAADNYSLEVTNPLGQLLFKRERLNSGHRELDLSYLSQGVYYFRIHSDSGTRTIRYMKQ